MRTIKQRYSSEVLDETICYFMKTILRLQNSGIEKLPIENQFEKPIKNYLQLAVELIIDGQPIEISDLILDTEYDVILASRNVGTNTLLVLRTIKELSKHIHYDNDYYGYIISTTNLWGNKVFEYAAKTFYPNVPDEFKEKYGINELIKNIPQEMFQLENY